MADLDELLDGLHGDGYRWEKGPASDANGKVFGMYLLGMPDSGDASTEGAPP